METLHEWYIKKNGNFFTGVHSLLEDYDITTYDEKRASSLSIPAYVVVIDGSKFDYALSDLINQSIPALDAALNALNEVGDGRGKTTTYSDVVTEVDTGKRKRTASTGDRNGYTSTVDGPSTSGAYVDPTQVRHDESESDVTEDDATHDKTTVNQHTVKESNDASAVVYREKLDAYRQIVYQTLSRCLHGATEQARVVPWVRR